MLFVFLIVALIFFVLKIGVLKVNLNLNFDIVSFAFGALKFRVRVSLITLALCGAWFTGLNSLIKIPTWAALVAIFVVLPSLYDTLFGRPSK